MANTPQSNQEYLSRNLTSLLMEVVRAHGSVVPKIVYAFARSEGFLIGSGVVESACKQITSQRMKLSGIRWHMEGVRRVVSLRCKLLSNIWNYVIDK